MSSPSQLSEVKFRRRVWGIVGLIGVLIVLFEGGRMLFEWARYGESTRIYLDNVFPKPSITWVGIQNVINKVWASQFWIVSIIVGGFALWRWSDNDDLASQIARDLKVSEAANK